MPQDMIRDSEEFQRALERAVLHAARCGLRPYEKVRVVPIWVGLTGEALAVDVIHPETREVVITAGTVLSLFCLAKMMKLGVDYVLVRNERPTSWEDQDTLDQEIEMDEQHNAASAGRQALEQWTSQMAVFPIGYMPPGRFYG